MDMNVLNTDFFDRNIEVLVYRGKDFRSNFIVGLGAMVLRGFTRERIVGNIVIPTEDKRVDGVFTGMYMFRYLPNYNTELGFEKSNIASPERIICDYFMYPSLRVPQMYDFMEEYGDGVGWDFSTTYEMMEKFGLNKDLLGNLIEETRSTLSSE